MPRARHASARGRSGIRRSDGARPRAALPIDRARAASFRPTIEQRVAANAVTIAVAILGAVQDFQALGAELQSTWHREIPLAGSIAIEVAGCSPHEITVRAPLAANRNLHGTVFAGSLFSVCVLAGWGMTWLALRQRNLDGTIVIASSRIQYRKAVTGDIVCSCRSAPDAMQAHVAQFEADGRAAVPLVCTIDVDGRTAVTFEGDYVVRRHKHSG
jgi:thioesterase domain-containing protein